MDVFFDPVFLKHDTGAHPENAGRLELLLDYLDESQIKKPRDGEEFLKLAHEAGYIEQVKLASEMGGMLDPDTPVSKHSYEAACRAVGAAVDASESALEGVPGGGFALVRPPGHHAFAARGSGFCIFNNMAIAAIKLAEHGKRVFILDIDVHHGNGTEALVLGKENIMFLSIHQSPLYPGSGLADREPNVINVPLPPTTGDEGYIKVLDKRVGPEIERFKPDVVGVSVGFDAYYLDRGSVAGNALGITGETYGRVKKMLKPYKAFFTLEGGYNPKSIMEGAHALMEL